MDTPPRPRFGLQFPPRLRDGQPFNFHPISALFLAGFLGVLIFFPSQIAQQSGATHIGYLVGAGLAGLGAPLILAYFAYRLARRNRIVGNAVYCAVTLYVSSNLFLASTYVREKLHHSISTGPASASAEEFPRAAATGSSPNAPAASPPPAESAPATAPRQGKPPPVVRVYKRGG